MRNLTVAGHSLVLYCAKGTNADARMRTIFSPLTRRDFLALGAGLGAAALPLPALADNMNAARGRLPDAAMRKRIVAYWEALG